jgi:hypothetical protein
MPTVPPGSHVSSPVSVVSANPVPVEVHVPIWIVPMRTLPPHAKLSSLVPQVPLGWVFRVRVPCSPTVTSPELVLVLPPKLLFPLLPLGAPPLVLLPRPLLLALLPLLELPKPLLLPAPIVPAGSMQRYEVSQTTHPPGASVPVRVGGWTCGSVVAVSVPLLERPMIFPGPLVHAARRSASTPACPILRVSAMRSLLTVV